MTIALPGARRLVGALAIALVGGGLVVLTPSAASAATCPAWWTASWGRGRAARSLSTASTATRLS